MAENQTDFPLSFSIDYPDRELNRVTSFFRIFTIIPIMIILSLLSGGGSAGEEAAASTGWTWEYSSAAFIFLPLVLMILFRKKYPKWWYDWNLNLTRFSTRVFSYLALLRDEYPSTDEEQAVHIEIPYPDVEKDLQRGMPLIKWFLAIPHYIILAFLSIAVFVSVVIAWFAILFTGRYPRDFFNFVVGVMRWWLRVDVYAFILTTDKYPPFSLEP